MSQLRLQVVTPTVPQVRTGNVFTADRYARILRRLGHQVSLDGAYEAGPADVLVALHARRSAPSIRRFAEQHPDKPLVVVLTGTDLYHDIRSDPEAQQSLELANRLVVLQSMGIEELPERLRAKTSVIYQSTPTYRGQPARPKNHFRVSVIGHLRPEKDPFRAAEATHLLPSSSRIRILHIGAPLSEDMAEQATAENQRNGRYRWVGAWPHWRTRRAIADSHLVAITSLMEGSSNVLCEALTTPTPVVASRISGLIGTLGSQYPGYFPPQDTEALAALLHRAESDAAFYASLQAGCAEAAPLVAVEHEEDCWRDLIEDLVATQAGAERR